MRLKVAVAGYKGPAATTPQAPTLCEEALGWVLS